MSCSAEEAAGLGACMLQPSLAGADCPSVVETAAASVFTHLDPAVRRVRASSVMQHQGPKHCCITALLAWQQSRAA